MFAPFILFLSNAYFSASIYPTPLIVFIYLSYPYFFKDLRSSLVYTSTTFVNILIYQIAFLVSLFLLLLL